MPRRKGTPKTGGRQKGSPNRVTRAVREFLTDLVDDALEMVDGDDVAVD